MSAQCRIYIISVLRFYDAPSLTFSEHTEERDISYWRRRGQDFSALLDFADPRELRVSGGPWRGPVLAAEELRTERPLARWEEGPWLREPIDSGPETLRVTGERKCQSLGTEEWRPAVGLGRQLSDGEAERWSQEQQHRLRPVESSVPAAVRMKSQSLPRVLSPEDPQYGELPQTGATSQVPAQRTSSSVPYGRYHSDWPIGERWSGQTQGQGSVALVPKPRFSRPVKPPSYETHQQNRGMPNHYGIDSSSSELLRDRSICYSQSAELLRPEAFRADLFYQELTGMEPPGYIPPPSYRRFAPPRSGQIYRADSALVRWKREPVSAEMGEWFSRTAGMSWSERREDRSMVVVPRRPVHPGPSIVPNRQGHVQYVPFDDPRIRHISGGPSGNSLTDADKIRHVNKELPGASALGQSTHDSAFLPIKVDKVIDKQMKADKSMDKGSSESVSTAKTEPAQEPEKKSVKKKLSETIFCLVSVPLSQSSGKSRDQNNNEEKEPKSPNTLGSLPNQSLKSTSTTSTDLELQALTLGSASSSIITRRAHRRRNSRTKIIKPNPHDELRRYSGAWPGDQYRDQETQTRTMGAPVAPGATGAPGAPGTSDPSTPYGYPMKGQKSLKPSSNSAFSRTGTFKSTGSHRPPLHPPPHPPPPPPNQPPSQPPPPPPTQPPTKSSPSDQAEDSKLDLGPNPEAFGQFLLKPVSRRSWDAIEELESINKELQEQAGKRPSVDQCIEDLNEAYKDILELSTASNNLPNLANRSSIGLDGKEIGLTMGEAGQERGGHSMLRGRTASSASIRDLGEDKQNTEGDRQIQGTEGSPVDKDLQGSGLGRRGRGLSQRIEALHDRFMAPPGHGSEERLARMREVDTVSRMRRLSLRSTDSWDGLYGVSFVSRAEEVRRDAGQSLPSSQELPNTSERVENERRAKCGSSLCLPSCDPLLVRSVRMWNLANKLHTFFC
uniref:Junctional cadherin 5 associated a n=1 Tax=Electrophorus electricus TaxID=8005 RepID=A0AAY5EDM2_ELEEL